MSECKHGSIPSHCPYCRIAKLTAERDALKDVLSELVDLMAEELEASIENANQAASGSIWK